jgi:PAS domain S-box-containing protein
MLVYMAPRLLPSWSDDEAQEFASILDLANDAILVMDLNSNIQFWNRGAERLYGWRRDEALGQNCQKLLRTISPVPLQEILAKIRATGEWRGELVHTSKDGRAVEVASRWTPRTNASGRLIGTFEINRDITEDKSRQEHGRNAERLANLGRLTATVAHEINNPLEALTNIFYLLKQEPQSEVARGLIREGEAEVKCISDITNATLRYSRSAILPAEISLRDILDNVLMMYSGQIRARQVSVEKRYRAEGRIVARAGEIRQLIANLIGNALDALPNGGKLRVGLTAAGHDGFRVAIADHGTGIPAAARERIFDPFFTTKGASGTGLGLWIARDIVEKHRGSIHVRSYTNLGRSGTVFVIYLPKRPGNEELESSVA